jgi:hypothetical protein
LYTILEAFDLKYNIPFSVKVSFNENLSVYCNTFSKIPVVLSILELNAGNPYLASKS